MRPVRLVARAQSGKDLAHNRPKWNEGKRAQYNRGRSRTIHDGNDLANRRANKGCVSLVTPVVNGSCHTNIREELIVPLAHKSWVFTTPSKWLFGCSTFKASSIRSFWLHSHRHFVCVNWVWRLFFSLYYFFVGMFSVLSKFSFYYSYDSLFCPNCLVWLHSHFHSDFRPISILCVDKRRVTLLQDTKRMPSRLYILWIYDGSSLSFAI